MQILLKLAEILTFTNQAYFRRIYVESSQYNNAWISLPICNDKLTFDQEAFFIFCFSGYANLSHTVCKESSVR